MLKLNNMATEYEKRPQSSNSYKTVSSSDPEYEYAFIVDDGSYFLPFGHQTNVKNYDLGEFTFEPKQKRKNKIASKFKNIKNECDIFLFDARLEKHHTRDKHLKIQKSDKPICSKQNKDSLWQTSKGKTYTSCEPVFSSTPLLSHAGMQSGKNVEKEKDQPTKGPSTPSKNETSPVINIYGRRWRNSKYLTPEKENRESSVEKADSPPLKRIATPRPTDLGTKYAVLQPKKAPSQGKEISLKKISLLADEGNQTLKQSEKKLIDLLNTPSDTSNHSIVADLTEQKRESNFPKMTPERAEKIKTFYRDWARRPRNDMLRHEKDWLAMKKNQMSEESIADKANNGEKL